MLCLQILLNDLDVSSSHMERLIKELNSSQIISQSFLEAEIDNAKESVSSLSMIIPRFRSTLRVRVISLRIIYQSSYKQLRLALSNYSTSC